MRIGDGKTDYEWVEGWALVPDSESASSGWAHHDVVVTASGDVISFHPGDSTMLVFDSQGKLSRSSNPIFPGTSYRTESAEK